METERTAVTVPALQQLKRDGMDLPWGCFRERIGHGRCRCPRANQRGMSLRRAFATACGSKVGII